MNVTASLPPSVLPNTDPHLLSDFEIFDYPLAPSWVSAADPPIISPLDCDVDLDPLAVPQQQHHEHIIPQPQVPAVDFPHHPQHHAPVVPASTSAAAPPVSFPLSQSLLDIPLPASLPTAALPTTTPSDTTSASSQRLSTASTIPSTPSVPDPEITHHHHHLLPLRPTIGRVQKQTRRYTAPKSSRYCHLCARHQRSVSMVPCGNVELGLCQKSVCSKCIDMYHLQVTGPSWACPHCQNKCPARAKCFAYDRQTARRREKTMKAKLHSINAKNVPVPQVGQ